MGAPPVVSVDRRTFDGAPVVRLEVDVPGDVPAVRDRLHAAGIETFEADVRFAMRYLIERRIKAGCLIEGEATASEAVNWVFVNPTLRPADVSIEPRVLSFDIETDLNQRLLAISIYGRDIDEVLIVDASEREMPERAVRCPNEFAALEAFCERVRLADPDVLTGWNIVDFDLAALLRIAGRVRHPFDLGRDGGPMRLRKAEGYFGSGQASIPGRLVLDGIDLLRGGACIRAERVFGGARGRHGQAALIGQEDHRRAAQLTVDLTDGIVEHCLRVAQAGEPSCELIQVP